MSLGPAGSYSPRAAECSSEICKTNLVSLLREAKQLLEHVNRLEEDLMDHIVTGSEQRGMFQELLEHWDTVHCVPTKEDMADIAIRMTDEAEEHVASGSEEEIDSDGQGPKRDGESAEITGSSSGTDLSSEGL